MPLREVIQLYSEITGNQVRMSRTLLKNNRFLDPLYSASDNSWLEEFSRIEIFNEESGKKEIILMGNYQGGGPAAFRTGIRSASKTGFAGSSVKPQKAQKKHRKRVHLPREDYKWPNKKQIPKTIRPTQQK